MKRNAAVASLLILVIACATIAPGNDPIVVEAERVEKVAFATVDAFLKIERDREAEFKKLNPQVHAFAEAVRVNGPGTFRHYREVIAAYKSNRTADKKADLVTVMAVIQRLMDIALSYLASAPDKVN